MASYFSLGVSWVFFFAVHSIMASSTLKNSINTLNPHFKSYYRLIFNLVSLILLIPIIYLYFQLPAEYLYKPGLAHEITGVILALSGTFILIDGFKNYRTDEFIGTYQIKNHHEFHPASLNKSGWNGIVRHPLYFGGILLAIGLLLFLPTVKLGLSTILILAYLYVGTLWEEKKLIAEFGEKYTNYQQEVSMLLPLKWLLNKIQ